MQIQCPECASFAFKKNGYTRHGKQNHRCLDCGRQFSADCDELTKTEVAEYDSVCVETDISQKNLG